MEKRTQILIAEEGTQQGKLFRSVLSSHGFEVSLTAKDGREVINRLKKESFDVLIMDTFMPRLDALGVLKELNSPDIKKHPVRWLFRELIISGSRMNCSMPVQIIISSDRLKRKCLRRELSR